MLNVDLLMDDRAGVRDQTAPRSAPKCPLRLVEVRRVLDRVRADEVK